MLVPRSSEAVLWVRELGALGEKASAFENLKLATFLAQLQGFGSAHDYVGAVASQAGVDLRSREEIRKVGIDPAAGLGVVLFPGRAAVLLIGVGDEGRLSQSLGKLAAVRLGARVSGTTAYGGVVVRTFSRTEGGPPELGWTVRSRVAMVAAGESVSRLAGFAGTGPAESLGQDPAFQAVARRLPAARDGFLYFPPGSALAAEYRLAGAALTWFLGPNEVALHADLPWREVAPALRRAEGPDAELWGALPDDAFLWARYRGDPKGADSLRSALLGPYVDRAIGQVGFDFKAEVLENLRPGAMLALSVAPTAQLGGGVPALDLRRTNPFRYVHLVVLASAKNPDRLGATLAKVPGVAQGFGAKVEPTRRGDRDVFVTTYTQGEGIHFGRDQGTVVLASPLSRLEATLDRLASNRGERPSACPLTGSTPLEAKIDLKRLADSIRALPSEAWGIGGFAIKATTVRWLDAMGDLKSIHFGANAQGEAVLVDVALQLGAP